MKNTLLSLLLVILSYSTFACFLHPKPEDPQIISYHKLYLHTDREYYFVGDTLRFSGYLLNPQSHQPLPNTCNLHLEIASSEGEILLKDLFLIREGFCKGQLALNMDKPKKGNFILRAYTDFYREKDKALIFSKTIAISPITNTLVANQNKSIISKLFIDLFPEGGFLLTDRYNQMAFKTTDQTGKPINISGKLVNDKNETITQFSSTFNGTGLINFVPTPNSKYYLEINGKKNIEYNFPKIHNTGSKLTVSRLNSVGADLNIIADSISAKNKYYLVSMHRGQRSTFAEIKRNQSNRTIHIKNELLKHGINRLILLNRDFVPISERLIFVDKKEDTPLKLDISNKYFSPREKVELKISSQNNKKTISNSHLSIAVVDANSIPGYGISQNIRSYLLVDSELKGYIHNPASYFTNEQNISAAQKLNLLMMTQGWSNYIWNSLPESAKEHKNLYPSGLQLTGKLKSSNGKKALPNSEVILSINSSDNTCIDFTKSDSQGNYQFNNVLFFDSVTVVIQGKNGKNLNTRVSLDSISFNSPKLSPTEIEMTKHFSEIPITLYSKAFKNEIKTKEFFPDLDSRILKEIEVKAHKPKKEYKNMGRYRPYKTPTVTIEVEEKFQALPDVIQLLEGRVSGFPGLLGKNSRGEQALFLVDGIEVRETGRDRESTLHNGIIEYIKSISMTDIERVEILKYAAATIYGSRAAGGVVNIILKDGSSHKPSVKSLRGTIVERIKGFSSYREFYSPKYTDKNINTNVPDFRTTLYWNPSIQFDTSATNLSFFTCDNTGRYKILVEGISKAGKICLGEAEFEVLGSNEASNPKDKINQ